MSRTELANGVKAEAEETELEALVEVLGDFEAQDAAHMHTLPILVARVQVEE